MKKLIILFLCIFLMTGCQTKKTTEENNSNSSTSSSNSSLESNSNTDTDEDSEYGQYTVDFYLFHSNSCSHCQEEISWLTSIDGEYSYLNIHYYEVSENSEINQKVRDALGITSSAVPLTIIGNDYYLGFSSTKERKFIRAIKEASQKDLCDVVSTIINDGDVEACMAKNEEA